MASQPLKNRERAFRNMMRKIINDLWKEQLHNAAYTPSGQPLERKASYIYIARDKLQRLNLFKPDQFLRTTHNQLPLLRLRTQATSYISTHLHLSDTHTYTPYAERYCFSCLPLQILGNETHTLLRPRYSNWNLKTSWIGYVRGSEVGKGKYTWKGCMVGPGWYCPPRAGGGQGFRRRPLFLFFLY